MEVEKQKTKSLKIVDFHFFNNLIKKTFAATYLKQKCKQSLG